MQNDPFSRCIVFAGPTRTISKAAKPANSDPDPAVQWHGPIRRGDLERLTATHAPTNVAIVDGIFHSYPAVGHAEIDQALQMGWRIWGLSSMGAIRAVEMADCGVRGYGRVFRMFLDDDDFSDDEVTLIHQSEAPYNALSEPLVHLREYLRDLVDRGIAEPREREAVLESLKSRWYGYRTIEVLEHLIKRHVKHSTDALQQLADFDRFRIKVIDLDRFLSEQPWKNDNERRNLQQ